MTAPAPVRPFGRIPQWDDRNDEYRVRALLAAGQPPRSYTWPLRLPILDQNGWSGCVGWTAGEELAAVPDAVKGIDDAWCLNTYFAIQDSDEWPGSERPGDSPHFEGTSMLAMAKHLVGTGHWTGYRWARTLAEVIQAVGHAGPMPIGVDWTSGCMATDADGFVHPERGGVVGGHAVLLRGHSARRRAFRGRNHWTARWGQGGEFWVSYAGVEWWLAHQGEFILPVRRTA